MRNISKSNEIRERRTNDVEIEEILNYMLTFFQDIDKRRKELNEEQSVIDKKQDEILHYIENHNTNASQSCRLIKILKEIRFERRQIKNEIEIVDSLKDNFVDKYKNKFIERDIIQALKDLKDRQEKHSNVKYSYKYLTKELEIKDDEDNITNLVQEQEK